MSLCRLLAVLALSALALPAQTTPKRIYIAPDDHTDYYWTADEATYRQAFLETLDHYLNLADATAGAPAPYQSRWNCDGALWVWTYEKNKPAADFQRLIARLRSGHVSMPLTTAVSVHGGTPAEAVLRDLYYAGRLERRFNLRFPLAVAMENQVLPFGLGSLWAGAGAKYSWRGVCACATKVTDSGNREHEVYWMTGPDNSRILMKWNSLYRTVNPASTDRNQAMGGYAEARFPGDIVEFVDTDGSFRARHPYSVIGAFGQGWDDLKTIIPLGDPANSFPTVAQAKSNASRQVIVSNQQDFFEEFESRFGASLPTQAVSFGNEWELSVPSLAEVAGRVKRAVERLRAAEALATLVSLESPTFLNGRQSARDQAFVNLGLFWEHNWVGGGPVPNSERAAWSRRIGNQITSYVDTLHRDAAAALGGLIPRPTTNTRFYVFNPLGWVRSDHADYPYTATGPVHVVEAASGAEVPSQIVTVSSARYLRIWAANVPSVGYKVYEIRSGAGQAWPPAATISQGNTVLENAAYRLTLNGRGAITSLIDKSRSNAELVSPLNGYALNDLSGSGSGTVTVDNAGPVSVTVRANSGAGLAHDTRITLFRQGDRIDIRNEITQNFTDLRAWTYSFNLPQPDVRHEEVGAVIRARLAPEGDYSPRLNNVRYDWLTMNHFADMTNGANSLGVTLSNADLYFMRLGNSTPQFLDTATPQLTVLAGGRVDSPLGMENQGGDTRFLQRFSLRGHGAYDGVSAMRFAVEHQNPLVAATVTGTTAAPYPADTFSLLSVSNPDVLLWALKPAEEGIQQGVIARVWNQSTAPASFQMRLPGARPLVSARRTTHIETDLGAATVTGGALEASAAQRQLLTFRLLTSNATPAVSLRINAGGGATGTFAADSSFQGGTVYVTTDTVDVTATNAAPAAVYRDERYGTFAYTTAGLTPGAPYVVRLHFAEHWWGVAGRGGQPGADRRRQDVTINGTRVLANFDIFAAAGSANRAVVHDFAAAADGAGQVVIRFAPVSGSADQNAKVDGIEVLSDIAGQAPSAPAELQAAVSGSAIVLTWAATPGAASYAVFRATTANGQGTTPLASGLTTPAYTDSTAAAGTRYYYRVRALNANGTSTFSREASAVRPAATSGVTVLTTQQPVIADANDGVPYELGMKFRANTTGTVTAIRYWKPAGQTGTPVGRIWSSAGAVLASVTFTSQTASGWQQASLSTPLSIAASTTYVVTASSSGFYPFTMSGLATAIANGPLSSVADGANGVYGPPGQFPTNSYSNSNYFRDVVFVAAPAAATTTSVTSRCQALGGKC